MQIAFNRSEPSGCAADVSRAVDGGIAERLAELTQKIATAEQVIGLLRREVDAIASLDTGHRVPSSAERQRQHAERALARIDEQLAASSPALSGA